jgi:hypothetical protein
MAVDGVALAGEVTAVAICNKPITCKGIKQICIIYSREDNKYKTKLDHHIDICCALHVLPEISDMVTLTFRII